MHQIFSDLWKVYPEHSLKNRTWHWWWWLYFLENPERPDFPKQLMVLWGTRNCRKVRVNDYLWAPRLPMEVAGDHATFECMVASWYYDGEKMHDPLIIDHGPTETIWDDQSGRIRLQGADGSYSFGGSPADLWMNIESKKVGIELSMRRWTDPLAELIPTGKEFFRDMGYSMLKYRALTSAGKIRVGNSESQVKGRSYFQKVRISSLTPCWYWGTVQWDNGAYLQYFLPRAGLPMLRHSLSHESMIDWGEKTISKTLNFFDPGSGRDHLMNNVEITKRYDNDLPIFTVTASGNGSELSIEMATHARCCWNISQPLIGPIWQGIFYNEYPATVTDFKFKSGNRQVIGNDFGKSYCNCEDTWGTI